MYLYLPSAADVLPAAWDMVCWTMPREMLQAMPVYGAMLLLFLLGRTAAERKGGFFTSIACVLLMAIALWFSLWQRSDYLKADTAIVMRPVSAVKSAPSAESSTDLFVLHEGTKITILDEVGQWRNVSLADGRQGWMLSSDMEVI